MKKFGKYALNMLLGLVMSIPVITLADSLTAMHFVNFKLKDDESISVGREFFKSFKLNFKQSLAFLFIYLIFGGLITYLWISTFTAGDDGNMLVRGLILVATLIFFGFETASSYFLAKFSNTVKGLLVLSGVALTKYLDITIKLSLIETVMIALPLLIVEVNTTAVTLSVGIVLFLIIMYIYEIVSANFMTKIFDALISKEKTDTEEAKEE